MPAKKPKTKTSSSKLAKQSKLHFRWYMAVVLIAIVAVVGILVVRFSNAATYYLSYRVSYEEGHTCLWQDGIPYCNLAGDNVDYEFRGKLDIRYYCNHLDIAIQPGMRDSNGNSIKFFRCLPKK